MGLFFDQGNLNQKLEEATVRDHTNMRNWSERRKRRYDRVMNEPLMPKFCTVCFYSMIIATSVMAIFDLYASLTYLSDLGFLHMMRNVSTSAFYGWLLFAVPLIPCCLWQLHKGFSDPYFEKFLLKRNGKPRMPLEKKFRLYTIVAVAGIAVFFFLYLLVRIFL